MVSYTKQSRRGLLWRTARTLMMAPGINYVLVEVLTRIPAARRMASRIPVVNRNTNPSLTGDERVVLLDTGRCQIAKEVFWSGGQLEKPSDRLALDAAIKLTNPEGIFLDVGAYTGLFALSVARAHSGVTAYAYEIVPENY